MRLKKTWAILESTNSSTVNQYKSELLPLADPGNGIYAAILDRVIGMYVSIYIYYPTNYFKVSMQSRPRASHSSDRSSLPLNEQKYDIHRLSAITQSHLQQSGAGQGRAGDDVAAAARIQSMVKL